MIEALEPWLREKLGLVSRKSKLGGDPLRLSRWASLSLFLGDGRIEIDSSVVERAIRSLALNRKNALFAGSDGGGQHRAVIASLVETCKLVGVEPQAYLADVVTRIVEGHPQRQLDDLLQRVQLGNAGPKDRGLRTAVTIRRLPGPLGAAAQTALEDERGGAHHTILMLDGTSCHSTHDLVVRDNIFLLPLPALCARTHLGRERPAVHPGELAWRRIFIPNKGTA